jgi:phosphoribosylglycinamide formyltransferase-1
LVAASGQRHAAQRLDAQVVLLVVNNPGRGAEARAARLGIPCQLINHRDHPSRASLDTALIAACRQVQADLVVMAGWMRIVTPLLVQAYPDRLLNIHPSLLPAFPGLHTHQRALDAGCKLAGATVHQVTAELDHGTILAQAVVPVLPGDDADTLAARVLTQEHLIYPRAIAALLSNK